MRQRQCLTLRVFELPILIDTLLDEDPLQRSGQVLLLTLAEQDLQLLGEELLRPIHAVAQQLADAGEERLLVADDTAVGADADLAVGEGIERVDGLVRGDPRR